MQVLQICGCLTNFSVVGQSILRVNYNIYDNDNLRHISSCI
jgi:hypothetical protein